MMYMCQNLWILPWVQIIGTMPYNCIVPSGYEGLFADILIEENYKQNSAIDSHGALTNTQVN